jgi:serine/threonine protein phosphatase PrpC
MSVNLTVYGQTDVGLVRKKNEDAFVIANLTERSLVESQHVERLEVGDGGVLLAVSDGLGGHKAGEVASAIVVESLRSTMEDQPEGMACEALIEMAVEKANHEVWEAAHEPGRERMGATVTALFVRGASAYIAEVGDSRAYLLRGNTVTQVTHDQSYVQFLIDSGAITPEQAGQAPMRNIILQAMGQGPEVTVALGRLALRQNDCFLLCSDGLSNELTAEEMRRVLLESPRINAAGARLVELAKRHGGSDNVTVVLGALSGDLPPLEPAKSVADTIEVLKEFQGTRTSA